MKAIDEIKHLLDLMASGDLPPDEPLFTLRARDSSAPATVIMWSTNAHQAGTPDEKCNEAMELAAQMRHWPMKQIPGRPDTRTYKGTPVEKAR